MITVSLLLALLPVSVTCVLILVCRCTALAAAFAGVIVAIAVAMLTPQFSISWTQSLLVITGTWSYALDILLVLLGGVLLYRAMSAGGGLDAIAAWVQSRIAHDLHLLLVVVFGVGVFFESATGFGVGILVTAPLLLAAGYAPMQAAFLALLSQCAVTWGALAIGTVVGAELSGISAVQLALHAVPLNYPFLLLCGSFAVWAAGLRSRYSLATLFFWILVYATLLSLIQALATYVFGVELAGCLAGASVVVMGSWLACRAHSRHRVPVPWTAVGPFALLVTGLISTRLLEPVKHWSLSLQAGGFAPLHHAGFWLLMAALLTLWLLPPSRRDAWHWLKAGYHQWLRASAAVTGFLLVGQIMKYSGMTVELAASASAFSGHFYALYAPVLGALGGFLTASNASSNALFMEFQVKTASTVGMPAELAAAVQNAAGSNVTLASPGRVVFAASIVGDSSAESTLLRQVLPVAIGGTLAIALLTSAWWRFFS